MSVIPLNAPPASELQRFADSVARRMLADSLDADSSSTSTRLHNGTVDGETNGGALLCERELVPALGDVDGERCREAA